MWKDEEKERRNGEEEKTVKKVKTKESGTKGKKEKMKENKIKRIGDEL